MIGSINRMFTPDPDLYVAQRAAAEFAAMMASEQRVFPAGSIPWQMKLSQMPTHRVLALHRSEHQELYELLDNELSNRGVRPSYRPWTDDWTNLECHVARLRADVEWLGMHHFEHLKGRRRQRSYRRFLRKSTEQLREVIVGGAKALNLVTDFMLDVDQQFECCWLSKWNGPKTAYGEAS